MSPVNLALYDSDTRFLKPSCSFCLQLFILENFTPTEGLENEFGKPSYKFTQIHELSVVCPDCIHSVTLIYKYQ